MLVLKTFVVTTTLLQNYLKDAEASLEVLITDLQLEESSSDQYREHIIEVHEVANVLLLNCVEYCPKLLLLLQVFSVIELATFCKGK